MGEAYGPYAYIPKAFTKARSGFNAQIIQHRNIIKINLQGLFHQVGIKLP